MCCVDRLNPPPEADIIEAGCLRRYVRATGATPPTSEVKTVPVGVVTELVEGDVYHWGALMAGALLGSLPVAIIYSFFVEYYVSGLTGAVKE